MKRWIGISFRFDVVLPEELVPRPHLLPRIQRLGELDCHLLYQEENLDLLNVNRTENVGLFSECLYLSHLWVLDAYEILRILKNRNKKFEQIYQEIKTIRVPLAKHERAGDNQNKYGYGNYPIIDPGTGKVGWVTDNENIFIRTDFATKMLNVLESNV